MTISGKIADYATKLRFEDLPPEVVFKTKRCLLDTLGCSIGGYCSEVGRIIRGLVGELDGPEEASVIGSGMRTSCLNATLANGVMLRYLDYLDVYRNPTGAAPMKTGVHSCEVIPAALAVGEWEHCSGKEVITAIVLGYELSDLFIDAVVGSAILDRGWNIDSRGAYIVPVVAGRLLGLSKDQIESAIGISGSHNMVLGILDAAGEENTMTKNLRFPFTAYGGIMAALMARRGITGPSRVMEGHEGFIQAVLDGAFEPDILTGVGERFTILDTTVKSFAADAHTLGHITATLDLVKEHDIKPEDVEHVNVKVGTRCMGHCGDPVKRYPTNKETADHSCYYLTAIAIIDRAVGPDQYTPEKLKDSKVRELIDKVTLEVEPSLDQLVKAYPGIVEIQTKQGDKYKCRVDYPRGHPLNPMTDQEIEAKFRSMASKLMSEGQMMKVIDTSNNFEKLDDISQLMKLLVF